MMIIFLCTGPVVLTVHYYFFLNCSLTLSIFCCYSKLYILFKKMSCGSLLEVAQESSKATFSLNV